MDPNTDGGFGCLDCGASSHYMVKDDIWLQVFPDYPKVVRERRAQGLRTALCIKCVEKRLGRSLTIEDFPMRPINENIFLGYKLGKESK